MVLQSGRAYTRDSNIIITAPADAQAPVFGLHEGTVMTIQLDISSESFQLAVIIIE